MCMVSVISQYGQDRIQPQVWNRDTFGEYAEILKRIAALDAKLGEPECHDPAKAEWMRAIEERLAKLEQTQT